MMINGRHRKDLEKIFSAAVAAVQPRNLIPRFLQLHENRIQLGEEIFPLDHFRNIYIAGAGKATASMAAETEKILSHRITDGVVAVKTGHGLPLKYIRSIEAGHPLPNTNSLIAADEIRNLLKKAGKGDLVIFLLSGGASSLMTDLPPDCNLQDLNKAFHLLLNSGASIHEMNIVRKHLSSIKGGQAAKLCNGAIVVNFVISDVIGNDLSVIGSGPTVADTSTFEEAMDIIDKYNLKPSIPTPIIKHLQKGVQKLIDETPGNDDSVFKRCRNYIIGDNNDALKAAASEADKLGYLAQVVSGSLNGTAESVAHAWIKMTRNFGSVTKFCLLGGGETTVMVMGKGKGGRNQHLALLAAIDLKDDKNISLLAAGTDGTDGPTDAAGAIVDTATYSHAVSLDLSPEEFVLNNDAYTFFEKAGGHLKTGPTQTNVMDILVTLVN